jgi:isopentenyl-diphosphate delta-isomerase
MVVTHSSDDELLDLVDLNDSVIGTLQRSQAHAQQLHNFRTINAFLVNEKGELWIPRRTAHKKLFPLHLDVSVGGHVSSGETYDQAFRREMQEEVGLILDTVPYKLLGKLVPHIHGISSFMHVYKFLYNEVPPYNSDDFVEYYWMRPEELLQQIKTGQKVKGDMPLLLEHFLTQLY